ncbi:MAG: hypothetical protein ABW191_06715 [Aliihoeflea sp.]|jgi:hypothetical protein
MTYPLLIIDADMHFACVLLWNSYKKFSIEPATTPAVGVWTKFAPSQRARRLERPGCGVTDSGNDRTRTFARDAHWRSSPLGTDS